MKTEKHFQTTEDGGHAAAGRAALLSGSTRVSFGINLAVAFAQGLAGVLFHSRGLLADGIHSLSDLIGDLVILLAIRHSKKGADADHPYGYHRFETGATLALGVLLAAAGIGILGLTLRKLEDPTSVRRVHIAAFWVVAGVLIAKELLFRYMLRMAKHVKSSMLVANAWHARSDAASSLVVGIGIVGNLAGYPMLDPIAALMVGILIFKMGWKVGWEALHDLMDRAVSESEVSAIQQTLLGAPGVMGIHDLRTRRMGDMITVDVHIEVDASISVEAGHAIAVEARRRALSRHRVLNVMTHVDPHRQIEEGVLTAGSGFLGNGS